MSHRQVRWHWFIRNGATVLHVNFPGTNLRCSLERRPFKKQWYLFFTASAPRTGPRGRSAKQAIRFLRGQYAVALAKTFAEVE